MRYPTVFKKDNRNVELTGEAYFQVEAEPERPFYVNTPNGLSVYVYGTQFNVTAYEDDNAYYILIKGDVKDRDTEYAKDNHEDLLKEMKSDEFQKKLTGWVEKLDIKVNNKAIKRYTPKVVYDKQTEYYSKNNKS